jgi:diguanylate cyclase (GGDEF)-like protein
VSRLEAILASLEDAVIAVDAEGRTIAANPAGAALHRAALPLYRVARGERFIDVAATLVADRVHRLSGTSLEGGGGVLLARDVTEERGAIARRLEEAGRLALIDELTGLTNRRGFTALAEQQMRFAQRTRRPLMIFYADVDDLKRINDEQGHGAGDRALRACAELLLRAFRRSDVVARIGGDEFAVLAIDASEAHGEIIDARIAALLSAHNAAPDLDHRLSLSTGFAVYDPETAETLEALIGRADTEMYRRKRASKSPPPAAEPGGAGPRS